MWYGNGRWFISFSFAGFQRTERRHGSPRSPGKQHALHASWSSGERFYELKLTFLGLYVKMMAGLHLTWLFSNITPQPKITAAVFIPSAEVLLLGKARQLVDLSSLMIVLWDSPLWAIFTGCLHTVSCWYKCWHTSWGKLLHPLDENQLSSRSA